MTTTRRRCSDRDVDAFQDANVLGMRAGAEHRYTGVWVVVVERRVFVRSYNDKPTGWYRAFRDEPLGSVGARVRRGSARSDYTRAEPSLAVV
jgi:hypothetical protein